MAKPPPAPHDDELAREVDDLLKKLPAAEPEDDEADAATMSAAPPADVSASGPIDTSLDGRYPRGMVWGRVALGVALAAFMSQWPYTTACDFPLYLYLAAILVLLVTASWGGVWAWRRHVVSAHLVALAVFAYGGVLATGSVLPRVGYAKHAATWRCSSVPTTPALTPQRRPTEVGYAPLGPDSLYYASTGTGPPVILIGGASMDHRQWEDVAFSLASRYRVVRYDAPGSGRSPRSTVPVAGADALDAIYRELRLSRARMVGHGNGGTVALDFASRTPDRVEALVLIGARPSGYRAFTPFDQNREQVVRIAQRDGVEGVATFFLGDAYYLPEARLRLPTRARADHLLRQNAKVWNLTVEGPDAPAEPPVVLGAVTVSTLIIVPEFDYPDLVALADTMHARLSNAQKLVVPQRGHMLQISDPERLTELLFTFFEHD